MEGLDPKDRIMPYRRNQRFAAGVILSMLICLALPGPLRAEEDHVRLHEIRRALTASAFKQAVKTGLTNRVLALEEKEYAFFILALEELHDLPLVLRWREATGTRFPEVVRRGLHQLIPLETNDPAFVRQLIALKENAAIKALLQAEAGLRTTLMELDGGSGKILRLLAALPAARLEAIFRVASALNAAHDRRFLEQAAADPATALFLNDNLHLLRSLGAAGQGEILELAFETGFVGRLAAWPLSDHRAFLSGLLWERNRMGLGLLLLAFLALLHLYSRLFPSEEYLDEAYSLRGRGAHHHPRNGGASPLL